MKCKVIATKDYFEADVDRSTYNDSTWFIQRITAFTGLKSDF